MSLFKLVENIINQKILTKTEERELYTWLTDHVRPFVRKKYVWLARHYGELVQVSPITKDEPSEEYETFKEPRSHTEEEVIAEASPASNIDSMVRQVATNFYAYCLGVDSLDDDKPRPADSKNLFEKAYQATQYSKNRDSHISNYLKKALWRSFNSHLFSRSIFTLLDNSVRKYLEGKKDIYTYVGNKNDAETILYTSIRQKQGGLPIFAFTGIDIQKLRETCRTNSRKGYKDINLSMPTPKDMAGLLKALNKMYPCLIRRRDLIKLAIDVWELREQSVAFPEDSDGEEGRSEKITKASIRPSELGGLSESFNFELEVEIQKQAALVIKSLRESIEAADKKKIPPGGLLASVLLDFVIWDNRSTRHQDKTFQSFINRYCENKSECGKYRTAYEKLAGQGLGPRRRNLFYSAMNAAGCGLGSDKDKQVVVMVLDMLREEFYDRAPKSVTLDTNE